MQENMIITRKINLFPIGDKEEVSRVYKYIKDGTHAQNKAYNILLSNIYCAMFNGKESEYLNNIYKKGKRNPVENDAEYSLYKYGELSFAKGLSTAGTVGIKVKQDIQRLKKEGLFKGFCSLPNKKLNSPLLVESSQFKFIINCENYANIEEIINTNKFNIEMKFVNNIRFNVIIGSVNKSKELRNIFKNIFENNYKICGSSIEINKEDIILNLSIQIPIIKKELNEDIVVGVDLGIKIPAMCSINNNDKTYCEIGNINDFLRVRMKIQEQRNKLQKSLKFNNGGHGRKKKMKPLINFKEYEKNFVNTYNHMISKKIIDFALKNNAKYINIEDLSGFNSNNFILRNWSYYGLQQDIIYKANKNGIIVRFINPYNTSQTCSICGNLENGQRINQAHFKCKKCGYEANADFNASRNIAKSENFI